MEPDEKIKTHLLSVWLEEKKLFRRGKECMFFTTDRCLYFVSKTVAKPQWWKSTVQRQILMLIKDPSDTICIHDGYSEKNLMADLVNKKNMMYEISDVVDISSEEKVWGSVLVLKLRDGGKEKKFHLSIVKDWVSYPVKSPMNFLKPDWSPLIEYIRLRMSQ
jgi:hypothetical protein